MEILYSDPELLVCLKPAGVLSTDEPGGLPELLRQALGDARAEIRTVHRPKIPASSCRLLLSPE